MTLNCYLLSSDEDPKKFKFYYPKHSKGILEGILLSRHALHLSLCPNEWLLFTANGLVLEFIFLYRLDEISISIIRESSIESNLILFVFSFI